MTFKKINENKLIITFHSVELPEFMDLDELVSNTDEIKQIFIDLLDEAKEKVGFNADNYTINIDTKVTLNDDIIIEVTKLVKIKKHSVRKSRNNFNDINLTNLKNNVQNNKNPNSSKADNKNKLRSKKTKSNENENVKVKPKLVSKSQKNVYSVYKFIEFEDYINFCTFLKSSNIKINIKKISNECKLFKYSNNYFLTLKNINENYSKIGLFYTGITEFSKFCMNSDSLFPILNEHGILFIPNNAITTTIKSFC